MIVSDASIGRNAVLDTSKKSKSSEYICICSGKVEDATYISDKTLGLLSLTTKCGP